MATNVGYLDSNKPREERRTSVLRATGKAIGRMATRTVRMLSFEAPNIFKSKDWPYY